MHQTTRPLPRRAIATILLAIPLIATACSDDDDTAPPPTSAVVENTASETTPPPESESTAASEAPATTDTPATTSHATTTPTDDVEIAKEEVIAAAEHAWHVFNEAKLDPTNDEKLEAALSAHASTAQQRIREIIESYRSNHRRSITSEIVPASIGVDEGSVIVDLPGGTATVNSCIVNSNVLVEVQGNPDGTDRVLDDSITANYTAETFARVGTKWVNVDGAVLQAFEGALTCEPNG